MYVCCYNLFHTNTMYSPWPLGLEPNIYWIYAKRINANEYQCQFNRIYHTHSYSASSINMNNCFGSLHTKTPAQLQAISPDLICDNDGDERVLVWAFYLPYTDWNKMKMGFFILPIAKTSYTANDTSVSVGVNFQYKVVFTPKPGLFPVKNG